MGKIVLTEFLTLDGVMGSPHHWNGPFFDQDVAKYKLDEVMASDALLLGRITYDEFAAAWPGRSDPDGFADRFNSMPKYVVSATLSAPAWNNTHVIHENLREALAQLREEHAGDIVVHGSGTLARTLMTDNLIDEYRLMIHPVVLGGGLKLFPDGATAPGLELVEANPFPNGNVVLTYRPRQLAAAD